MGMDVVRLTGRQRRSFHFVAGDISSGIQPDEPQKPDKRANWLPSPSDGNDAKTMVKSSLSGRHRPAGSLR